MWTDEHSSHLQDLHDAGRDIHDSMARFRRELRWLVEHSPMDFTGVAWQFEQHAEADLIEADRLAEHAERDSDRFAELLGAAKRVFNTITGRAS